MSVEPGRRFGTFEVVGRLGAGGMPAEGGPARQVTTGSDWRYPNSFSPDGRLVACMQQSEAKVEVVIATVDGSRPPMRLGTQALYEAGPSFSPDGAYIVHLADAGDGYRVFVADASGTGRVWAVSVGEGAEPDWSRDGREIYYRKGRQFYAVDVQTRPHFRAGRPRLLFEAQLDEGFASMPNYDVTPDGSRFVAVQSPQGNAPLLELVYVPDWLGELREKLRG